MVCELLIGKNHGMLTADW